MANNNSGSQTITIGFLIIIVGLSSAILLPEFFSGLIQTQNSNNQVALNAIQIILVITTIFFISGSIYFTIGGKK